MPIAVEQITYRLRQVQSLSQFVAIIQTFDTGNPLFVYKTHSVELTDEQRVVLRSALTDIFADIGKAADGAIALGGTANLRILASVQAKPTGALDYLGQVNNQFERIAQVAEIVETEGQLTAVIAEDKPLRDMLATVGEAMKLWAADSKKKE